MVTGSRCFPVGAEMVGTGVHFRVWAPGRHVVRLVTEQACLQSFIKIAEEFLFFNVHRITASWLCLLESADLSICKRMSQASYIQGEYSAAISQHPAINQLA